MKRRPLLLLIKTDDEFRYPFTGGALHIFVICAVVNAHPDDEYNININKFSKHLNTTNKYKMLNDVYSTQCKILLI